MRKRHPVRVGILSIVAAAVLAFAAGGAASAQTDTSTYTVTIENLTGGQPFTPPVVVAHTNQVDLFEVGQAAPAEIMAIAENGNNEPLVTLVSGSAAVMDHAAGDGPIMPGESAMLSVIAPAGSLLSVVFMLICTNDGFSGVDSMVLPSSGSQTVDANSYDAGSEQNTEDFADIVPPCQGLIGVTSDDEGTGMSNPALAEGGVIAMHAGIQGGVDLTVADHGWTGPVARITVSVEDSGVNPPSAGTGPIGGDGAGRWLIYLVIGGVVLFGVGGGLQLARRRAAR